jgi:ubiquitin-protein ligase
MNPRRLTRLKNDYEEIKSTFAKDKNVDIVAIGALPPEKYRLVYRLPSMHIDQSGNPVAVDTTVVDIELPMEYPRVPPVAKTVGGDVVFHPNMDSNKICLMDRWHPASQIVDLIREIGDMLQWKRFNIRSPLNAFAAEWSQNNGEKIPLGSKELGIK